MDTGNFDPPGREQPYATYPLHAVPALGLKRCVFHLPMPKDKYRQPGIASSCMVE